MTESANPSNSDKLERADFYTVKETAWHLRSARSRSEGSSRAGTYRLIDLERHSGSRRNTLMPTPKHGEFALYRQNKKDGRYMWLPVCVVALGISIVVEIPCLSIEVS
jgi:hypothetical protein